MADTKLEIQWTEVPADRVVEHWMKAYRDPVSNWEWFFDASKKVFVFRLYVEKPASPRSSEDVR